MDFKVIAKHTLTVVLWLLGALAVVASIATIMQH